MSILKNLFETCIRSQNNILYVCFLIGVLKLVHEYLVNIYKIKLTWIMKMFDNNLVI